MERYSERVKRYLVGLYAPAKRAYACGAMTPEEVSVWQVEARLVLRRLLGMDRIAASADGHRPEVQLGEREDLGDYCRQRCEMETEPNVLIPFWLLTPKREGRRPLALTPHGHDALGYDMSAGVVHDEARRTKVVTEDRDVAVQAARHGFVAIAPATRGIGCDGVPDLEGRHGGRDCRSSFMHALLAGRTSMGERVWDMERLIDWAGELPNVDASTVLMLGNSGGGMVTLYAAACDTRITIAIPSCSYSSLVSEQGYIHHCDCNAVPGILEFGEFWDIAGLVAPRHLLTVNGVADNLHPTETVDRAVERLAAIYAAAGAPERYQHRYGDAGHRFYKDLMWPFVQEAMDRLV
jgi:hypothetical protein